jgi:cell division protein FtsB
MATNLEVLEKRVSDLEAQVKRLMRDLEQREEADQEFAEKIARPASR